MKNSDIADTDVFIRDISDPQKIIFRKTVPYFKRALLIDSSKDFDVKFKSEASYQICLLAKDSNYVVRNFYQEQCKDLSSVFSAANKVSNKSYIYLTVLLVICKYLLY